MRHHKISFIDAQGKKLVFLDLSVPCNRDAIDLEYLNVELKTEHGTIKRIILCPVNGKAFICNAVVELDSGIPSPEEIYMSVDSLLRRVGCTP
ncbi:hypothetical protein [Metallosphaera hakonensis]|uniref:hypothetical protein n=1 Tax=Metallosphaera hakonensis TaxID=79601 RepID=UPI001F105BDA|nr:hypothetical protein [Metallosphaera hakonensis]